MAYTHSHMSISLSTHMRLRYASRFLKISIPDLIDLALNAAQISKLPDSGPVREASQLIFERHLAAAKEHGTNPAMDDYFNKEGSDGQQS